MLTTEQIDTIRTLYADNISCRTISSLTGISRETVSKYLYVNTKPISTAQIHNSDYDNVETCKMAIDMYFSDRNTHFQINPKRAGDKIWGKERVIPRFSPSNNCKDPSFSYF